MCPKRIPDVYKRQTCNRVLRLLFYVYENANTGQPAACPVLLYKSSYASDVYKRQRLRYAINYGADAVYCGLPEFGMRSAPANFTPEQLAMFWLRMKEHRASQ